MDTRLKRTLAVAVGVFLILIVIIIIAGRLPGVGPVMAAGSFSAVFGLAQCAILIAVLTGLLFWFSSRRQRR